MSKNLELQHLIDHMTEEQAEYLWLLMNFFYTGTLGTNKELQDRCGIEGTIDTAYPQQWADKAREMGIDPSIYVWQYDEKNRIFGHPVSYAHSMVIKAHETFKTLY